MTIKALDEMKKSKIEIDLTGPDGNAYCLLALADDLAKKLSKDANAIKHEMMNGNYEHLLAVFDREFGEFVILYTDDKRLWGK